MKIKVVTQSVKHLHHNVKSSCDRHGFQWKLKKVFFLTASLSPWVGLLIFSFICFTCKSIVNNQRKLSVIVINIINSTSSSMPIITSSLVVCMKFLRTASSVASIRNLLGFFSTI